MSPVLGLFLTPPPRSPLVTKRHQMPAPPPPDDVTNTYRYELSK